MQPKHPFTLKEHLFFLVHGGSGDPCAFRVSVPYLFWFASSILAAFLIAFTGTLLFFRELEMNRKLSDRVLELENRLTLSRLSTISVHSSVSNPVATAPQAQKAERAEAKALEKLEERTVATIQDKAPAPIPASTPTTAPAVRARIADMTADCLEGACTIRLGMVPTGSGTAQGELLAVLETELPRIGMGNPASAVRKRFFIYPGDTNRDELNLESVAQLERKPFRFSRTLQTALNFHLDKTLRPVAAHVYLFDTEGNLVHHEQKPIKTDE